MVEVKVEILEKGIDKATVKELEKDIKKMIKLRLAKELLVKEWDRRFSRSKLTDRECIALGKKVNLAALERWKAEGWL
ncbi:MAG: hypothetical protein J7L44_01335 [Candidatus Diapherotrites archaeon]|nr:hypothetical protein [Candidatus Diapherotrites archaeon]